MGNRPLRCDHHITMKTRSVLLSADRDAPVVRPENGRPKLSRIAAEIRETNSVQASDSGQLYASNRSLKFRAEKQLVAAGPAGQGHWLQKLLVEPKGVGQSLWVDEEAEAISLDAGVHEANNRTL
jgi:hypothetical protein